MGGPVLHSISEVAWIGETLFQFLPGTRINLEELQEQRVKDTVL